MPFLMSQSEFETRWTAASLKVRAFLHATCCDGSLIEDLLQDVAMTAWRKRGDYDAERSFDAWLIGIARFAMLRQRRDVARQRVILAPELIEQIEAVAIADANPERRDALAHCMSHLDDDSRSLLRMKYQAKLPLADAAQRLGRSHGAIRTALSRLRDRLRACIRRRLESTEENS